jgi:hypothetical protein
MKLFSNKKLESLYQMHTIDETHIYYDTSEENNFNAPNDAIQVFDVPKNKK